MRTITLMTVLSLFASGSFAKDLNEQDNLFKCVDDESLEINTTCLNTKMENNEHFVNFQDNFKSKIDDLGGNVMSTVIFYPELMEIRVIAHMDNESSDELALNSAKAPNKAQ